MTNGRRPLPTPVVRVAEAMAITTFNKLIELVIDLYKQRKPVRPTQPQDKENEHT